MHIFGCVCREHVDYTSLLFAFFYLFWRFRRLLSLLSLQQDMLESSTWKDCGAIAPAWGASGSTGQTSECAPGSQQAATIGANSSPKGLEDFGAEARELEVVRLADLHADVSHIQEVRALVADFVGKGRGKHETASSPLPRRPSQPTTKDPAFTSQHEPCVASCASTAVSQLRQKDCNQAAVAVESVAESGGNTIPPPLVPRGAHGSRTAGLGSKAAFVAQLLVQVSVYRGLDRFPKRHAGLYQYVRSTVQT